MTFTSQFGTFDVSSLPELGAQQVAETPVAAPAPQMYTQTSSYTQTPPEPEPAPVFAPADPVSAPQTQTPSGDPSTIIAAIESLAGLHERGILSDDEFAAKKAELLARL